MLHSTLLALALATAPASTQSTVEFAFGDIFADDLATLGDQVALALERGADWSILFSYGRLTRRGTSYGLFGPGVEPVYLVVPDGPPLVTRGVEHRALQLVERGATGYPSWDRVETVLHVTRPVGATAAEHSTLLEQLAGAGPGPGALTGSVVAAGGATPVRRPRQVVLAHGLTPTDLRPYTFPGPGGSAVAWERLAHEHRARRVLRRVDLTDPVAASYAVQTFDPQGLPGNRVTAGEDDRYDAGGIDLNRGVARLEWNSASVGRPWVGFVLNLRDAAGAPLDASGPDVAVAFSVRGTTTQPSEAPLLYVALEDSQTGPTGLGREAHLAIDLVDITTFEQQVVIPLYRFQFTNHALDTSALVHLKFAARDLNVPGAASALAGDLEIFEPRLVVLSPDRRTPQNVFWSNDPVQHAAGGPSAPLSDRFLGQPGGVFKWFAGFGGGSAAAVPGLVHAIDAVLASGRTPHVVMEMWPAGSASVLAAIAAGGYDGFFRDLFEACRAREGRIELAPLHEANGFWYPWSSNGNEAVLRTAWRRIDALRDAADAHNVALAYVVSNLPGDPGLTRRAVAGFPGDDVVDMIGLQGFESGYDTIVDTYNELFTNILSALSFISDLPVVVTEYGFHTIPGAQQPKGQLYRWALEDQVAGRSAAPILGAWTFNVAKNENGAWRDWRIYDDLGVVVPAMVPWVQALVAMANHPLLASPDGRDAHLDAMRAHARVVARLVRL